MEALCIGLYFQEALQKACQSLEIKRNGLGADGKEETNQQKIMEALEHPSDDRLFRIYDAFKLGISFTTIRKLTKIDPWFLRQIEELIELEKDIQQHSLDTLPADLMQEAKEKGYADRQIAHLLDCLESEVHSKRKEMGINRVYKLVDTCAAEFEAQTPYYYSTFQQENESIASDRKKIIVLGSGPNRIGQGIEFDYCCVHGVLAAKEMGYETIMINCNPETVSTDFDIADKLYFEPVFWEHIYDIIQHEKPEGVIVQLGGQTALKLAEKLDRYGIPIIGTNYHSLDLAEDRGRFSTLLKENDIPYPKFGTISDAESALELSKEIGFPLLVRPSYVICSMQHIDPAGIHSGDSYAVLPPYNLGDFVMQQIEAYTKKIALALNTVGLINIQFVVKDDKVYIIEANPRASRTVPFICKAYREPYVNYATKVMLGEKKVKDFDFNPYKQGYAIKVPVFSFHKFPNVNKEQGPEMKSTGEAIYFIDDLLDDYFLDIYSERNLYLSK